jgi:acetyl-CoA carboxylase carboxyltransferase component
MGLEGAVNIIHGAELAAAPDEAARAMIHAKATEDLKRRNTGIEVAAKFEIDDIIDPADTRHFLGQTLKAMPTPATRNHRKRAIDAW